MKTEQSKAEVRRLAAEFRAQAATKERAPYVFTEQGIPDETGITPEARALLAKQRGEA